MATLPKEVTERQLFDYKLVQSYLPIGINAARKVVNDLNKELVAKGYLVVPHRVPAVYFFKRYGLEVKE